MKHINARPHINGNEPDTFRGVGRRLHSQSIELEKLLQDLAIDIVHGRNYQHLPLDQQTAKREEDLEAVRDIMKGVLNCRSLATAIYMAGEPQTERAT